ncbi:DUF3667 domain-containing protein [Chitinophaga flava]|uniref:DUF3667 domain-containing protein n=1 Tax=Chitinophaga flava TaxID=2259036 RepID=A0A365XPZ2_9BACT|nr:DUF3667 domain-containing protein [Chitinophaga flava]RBL88220.1 hypothetical protein DF182_16610 [Chitinophaga flava]
MKTQPLRQQQDCLNCGNDVPDRFCGHCGQENIDPRETFGHLVKHFVADIFHYDSQFLLTLKYLFTKPGFLSREHREGRRARYVNPIKLYIFTSFIFFFMYFAFAGLPHYDSRAKAHTAEDDKKGARLGSFDELEKQKRKLEAGVKQNDSGAIRNLKLLQMIATSTTVEEFDSIHNQLPDSLKFGPLIKLLARADARGLKRYGSNEEKARAYEERYYHNFPKIMFFCLPLFAFFLKLVYFRNKQWLYTDHAIFTLHFHAFAFIVMSVMLPMLTYFYHYFDDVYQFNGIVSFIIAGYLIIALHKNYGQSILKCCIKGIILYAVYITSLWIILVATNLLVYTYLIYF